MSVRRHLWKIPPKAHVFDHMAQHVEQTCRNPMLRVRRFFRKLKHARRIKVPQPYHANLARAAQHSVEMEAHAHPRGGRRRARGDRSVPHRSVPAGRGKRASDTQAHTLCVCACVACVILNAPRRSLNAGRTMSTADLHVLVPGAGCGVLEPPISTDAVRNMRNAVCSKFPWQS